MAVPRTWCGSGPPFPAGSAVRSRPDDGLRGDIHSIAQLGDDYKWQPCTSGSLVPREVSLNEGAVSSVKRA